MVYISFSLAPTTQQPNQFEVLWTDCWTNLGSILDYLGELFGPFGLDSWRPVATLDNTLWQFVTHIGPRQPLKTRAPTPLLCLRCKHSYYYQTPASASDVVPPVPAAHFPQASASAPASCGRGLLLHPSASGVYPRLRPVLPDQAPEKSARRGLRSSPSSGYKEATEPAQL